MILIVSCEVVPDADHDLILNLYIGVTPGPRL
jgi:hypothetical protein